jgi:O-antigen biosynthesis protein
MSAQTQSVASVKDKSSQREKFSPLNVVEIELGQPLPPVRRRDQYKRAWVLVRLYGEPLGTCVIEIDPVGFTADQFANILWLKFGKDIVERFEEAGLPEPTGISGAGLTIDPATWPFLTRQSEILADAPFITVLICTRNRPDQLANCLKRLDLQQYPHFEVVVVENVHATHTVQALVEARHGAVPHRYVHEPRSGLSWSRNTGIAAAAGEIVAFLDDDAEPDSHWLTGLARGFARGSNIGSVTGVVVPARLDTPAQELFEWLGGHSKGRGFTPIIFSRSGPQNPLYPLPPFGAGANLAFRREALERIGGLDVALGGGTPTRAGADTLALTLTLLEGYQIAYEPSALMWHHHRANMKSLREQLEGYSVGLTAYYTALLWRNPRLLFELFKLVPTVLNYMRDHQVLNRSDAAPSQLSLLNRRHGQGMLLGPLAYCKSRRIQARAKDY